MNCPFCNGEVKPYQGHNDITFFPCYGCGSVSSFGNLIDEDKVLSPERAIAMYRSRPNDAP